jgi:hypothetical protein
MRRARSSRAVGPVGRGALVRCLDARVGRWAGGRVSGVRAAALFRAG